LFAVDSVTFVDPPIAIRLACATFAAVLGGGGTKKSFALTAEPVRVDTVMRPEVLLVGTLVVSATAVAADTTLNLLLN
jgi:hypothetical protein